jgi:hypothetical protein
MSEKWGPWKTPPDRPQLGQIIEIRGTIYDLLFDTPRRKYSIVGMVTGVGGGAIELDIQMDMQPSEHPVMERWRARLPPEYEADAKRGVEVEA